MKSHERLSRKMMAAAGQYTRERDYWLEKLAGEPVKTTFPYDDSPAERTRLQLDTVTFTLDGDLFGQLLKLSNRSDVRLFVTLTTAVNVLLHIYNAYNDCRDILVGVPIYRQQAAGKLLNTVLPIRSHIDPFITGKQLLLQVSQTLYEANQHQNYPLETLLYKLDIPWPEEADFPLFDVAVLLENIHYRHYLDRVRLNTIFSFARQADRIDGSVAYNPCLFERASVERTARHFVSVLERLLSDLDAPLEQLEILSEAEKKQWLIELNGSEADYPRHQTIHRLFERQAEQTPLRTAVVYRHRHLSFGLLDRRANALARRLCGLGVHTGTVAALLLERSDDGVMAILGVLKAGGAYLALDPQSPPGRRRFMIEDSRAALVLTPGTVTAGDDGLVTAGTEGPRPGAPSAEDPAYVIYTSGSTGRPRGVVVAHRSVVNVVTWFGRRYRVDRDTRILQLTDYTFDPSVEQIFAALLHGGVLCVAEKEYLMDLARLRDYMARQQVQVINFVPLILDQLLVSEERLKGLRAVIPGGERLEESVKDRLLHRGYRVYNHYGPSETTIDALTGPCSAGKVFLGTPIDNLHCLILNPQGQPVPPGVVGELCFAGPNLALGYLNNPELTAARFINLAAKSREDTRSPKHQPLNPKSQILYRTGDLGRWIPGRGIEFWGRQDQQVKVMGNRVEPGEIENRLTRYPGVRRAVVIAAETEHNDRYLVAYVVAEPRITESDLRAYLADQLPGYMVPRYVIPIDRIPLTANGKVDRRSLPLPDIDADAVDEPPRDEPERQLQAIWAAVLEVEPERIGRRSNFFELGGHSLNAAVLISRIHKEMGVKIPMVELFKTPEIQALADWVRTAVKEKAVSIRVVEKREYYPLSSAQKRLYILQQLAPSSSSYNVPAVLKVEGSVDVHRFEACFKQLIRRHHSLRTSFLSVRGEPVQRVHEEVDFNIAYIDSPAAPDSQIRDFIRPFDLSQAPLLRVGLVDMKDGHLLMVDMHHVISDGTSTELLVRDFVRLFKGESLPPLRLQYKDYALWQHSHGQQQTLRAQQDFWLGQFRGNLPTFRLPTDFPEPPERTFAGRRHHFDIPGPLTEKIRSLMAQTGATLYMVLLAAFTVLLSRYSRQEDVVVGTGVAGRSHADLQDIIGMFVNMLVIRNRAHRDVTFIEYVQEVRESTLKAFDNRDFQFEELVKRLNLPRQVSVNPLFNVVFQVQKLDMTPLKLPGLTFTPYEYDRQIARFDLTLYLEERGTTIQAMMVYSSELFRPDTAENIGRHYLEVLEQSLGDPLVRLEDITVSCDLLEARPVGLQERVGEFEF